MMKQVLDKAFNKLVSRKLMVWLTATGFMLMDTVPLTSSSFSETLTMFESGGIDA